MCSVMFIIDREIRLHNLEEEKRIRKNRELLDEIERKWNKRESYLRSEYQKVRVLLQDAYKMNILATQYRNLASVLYIYDYMASSQASFTDTLIHEHMENGIQRIEAKLDSIVMQNEQIILHNRHQEALNSQMTEKTDNMIRTLQQTERNTMLAAQYAELSAVYSRANAYFGYANYLK